MHKSEKQREPAHDYHQTLFFIGESSDDQLKLIKERMSLIRFSPFEIETSEFKFLNQRFNVTRSETFSGTRSASQAYSGIVSRMDQTRR